MGVVWQGAHPLVDMASHTGGGQAWPSYMQKEDLLCSDSDLPGPSTHFVEKDDIRRKGSEYWRLLLLKVRLDMLLLLGIVQKFTRQGACSFHIASEISTLQHFTLETPSECVFMGTQ